MASGQPSPVLRAVAVLGCLLLAGCTASLAPDTAASEEAWPDLERLFPDDEPFTLRGRVVDPTGRPVAGAVVWVEVVDLREGVDNLDAYAAGRAETLRVTDGDGAFRISADDGLYRVAVEAPGFRSLRSVEVSTTRPFDLALVAADAPVVLAHRGASHYAPENTLPAIRKAAWLGSDVVEVDVRRAADGTVVLMHDADVDRTTDGSGAVNRMGIGELLALDAGAWFHPSFVGTGVPTLAQAVAAAREENVTLLLDLKAPAEDAAALRSVVFSELQLLEATSEVWVAAFRNATVQHCAQSGLQCAKISYGARDMDALLWDAVRRGAGMVMLDQAVVTPDVVVRAHAWGLAVHAWTVNDEEAWRRLIDAGVDGVLTDRPGYLLDVLTDRPPQEEP